MSNKEPDTVSKILRRTRIRLPILIYYVKQGSVYRFWYISYVKQGFGYRFWYIMSNKYPDTDSDILRQTRIRIPILIYYVEQGSGYRFWYTTSNKDPDTDSVILRQTRIPIRILIYIRNSIRILVWRHISESESGTLFDAIYQNTYRDPCLT